MECLSQRHNFYHHDDYYYYYRATLCYHHKLSGLKQYLFFRSQFCRSEVQALLVFCSESPKLKSRYQLLDCPLEPLLPKEESNGPLQVFGRIHFLGVLGLRSIPVFFLFFPSFPSLPSFLPFIFLINLYSHHGARTHDA